MNITIVGTGYSGLVTGTCFAELGVNVKCVDPDGQKINRLVYGDIPIYEPGLEAMVTRNVNANRLTFQADYEGAFDNADVVFCAIDPKLDRDGSTNLKPVIDIARTFARHLNNYSVLVLKTTAFKPSQVPKALILRNDKNSIDEATKSMREIVRNRYVYQKALLDDVVYRILYTASDKPLKERINFKTLDKELKTELMNNGVNIPYHFTVNTQDGREVYRCPDYTDEGEEYIYKQQLFRNDPQNKTGEVRIHFPDMNNYIFSSVRFVIPSVIFTFVLLITFIITLVLVFRQKKLTEIKNDFINNMTHELKTPIASISLAAQMLNDETVPKTPALTKHLGGVVNDESKRLRFLVEKVLQMSMFDRKKAVFKKKELDLNEMVESVANSFSLRVEHTGGKIYTDIGAVDSTIFVDEVHFQNVINNLLDNAVKYRKPDQPIDVYLKTWNDKDRLYLSVKDTGIGIKKDNIKKIFDKFYRVHTGNRHDAKGFGLGLAYVKKIVDLHDGEIKVESDYGKGTTFTISLPVISNE